MNLFKDFFGLCKRKTTANQLSSRPPLWGNQLRSAYKEIIIVIIILLFNTENVKLQLLLQY